MTDLHLPEPRVHWMCRAVSDPASWRGDLSSVPNAYLEIKKMYRAEVTTGGKSVVQSFDTWDAAQLWAEEEVSKMKGQQVSNV